jgi:hypothetical protein
MAYMQLITLVTVTDYGSSDDVKFTEGKKKGDITNGIERYRVQYRGGVGVTS